MKTTETTRNTKKALLRKIWLLPALTAAFYFSGACSGFLDVPPETRNPFLNVESTSGAFAVHEGKTLTLNIRLNKHPQNDVTIPVSLSNTTEATMTTTQLTFTPQNWYENQTVTIDGTTDNITDGHQTIKLVYGASVSDDPEYSGYTRPADDITVIDVDTDSVVVSPTSLTTTEAGSTASFTVVLSSIPSDDVTINSYSDSDTDNSEGSISGSFPMTFNSSNWSTYQTVTVTGENDSILDGDKTYEISLSNTSSPDTDYNNLTVDKVTVTNQDNESPASTVNKTTISMNEGESETFTVKLNIEPEANVTIPLTNPDSNRINLKKGGSEITELVFTPSNYDTAQTITVEVPDNAEKDGHIEDATISLGVAQNYNNHNPDDVTLTVYDNDTPGVEVVELNEPVDETETNSANYSYFRLRLTSQPTDDVTIPIDDTYNDGNTDYMIKPAGRMGNVEHTSVTFTATNWDTYQDIKYIPADDYIADGDGQFVIDLQACTSSDPNYDGLEPPVDIVVNYNDDDVAGFVTDSANGYATDDNALLDIADNSTWNIKLRSKPLSDITVELQLTADNQDGYFTDSGGTANNGTSINLTFTTSNWNTDQKVRVKGNSDGTAEGNQTYTVKVNNVTGDGQYANRKYGYNDSSEVSRPSWNIFSCDNDVNNFTYCRPSGNFNTTEGGGTAKVWVIGKGDPNDCDIVVSSSNTNEGTVSPATITVDSSNYNSLTDSEDNMITISGVNDAGTFDGNTQYNIELGAATDGGSGCNYTGSDPADISIRNIDNDQALEFCAKSGDTTEAGTEETFGVRVGGAGLSSPDTLSFSLSCATTQECDSVSPASLSFDHTNYDTCQTVTVTGKDDSKADGNQNIEIAFGAFDSTDDNYNLITPPKHSPMKNIDLDKVIFITDSAYSANFNSDLTQADLYCNSDTNKPSWGSYKAMLGNDNRKATSDGSTDADQNAWIMEGDTEYYLGSSTTTKLFTTNQYGFFTFGTLGAAFATSGDNYWTGLNTNWTNSSDNCNNWTSASSSYDGQLGAVSATNDTSISNGTLSCDSGNTRRIICVQQ